MKNFFLLLGVLLSLMLIFAGCGGKEIDCSTQNTPYVKYTYDEDQKECVVLSSVQMNECGNGVPEEGENYCNCPVDDGGDVEKDDSEFGCFGNEGDYLSYSCNEDTNSCELYITDKVQKNQKLVSLNNGKTFQFDVQVEYFKPFILDERNNNIKLKFLLKNIRDEDRYKIKDIVIRNVYVVTRDGRILGEKNINKMFAKKLDSYEFEMSLDGFSINQFEQKMSNVEVKALITFTEEIYGIDYSSGNDEYVLSESNDMSVDLKEIFERDFIVIDPNNIEEVEEASGDGWD